MRLMHQNNGAQAIDRSHGGATKLHALVEGSEKPIRCLLSAGGNACDMIQAGPLLAGPEVERLVTTKGSYIHS